MRINDQEANRLRLLKALRRAEPVSCTELVELTGLSVGTVSAVTSDLVRRGMLSEERTPPSGRGRPRVKLRLNPDAAYVLGAFLYIDGVLEATLSNLRGDPIHVTTRQMPAAPTIEAWIDQLTDALIEAIDACPIGRDDIHSVGLSLPALIDNRRGVMHWLQTYPLGEYPVAAMIEQRLKLPVFVDNNVNVFARAEHWFGEDRQLEDFSLIMVGLGLGFAQYVDGMLTAGSRGINPEFSHIKVMFEQGRPCGCGAQGCLMSYGSIFAIVEQACEIRGVPMPALDRIDETLQGFAEEAIGGDIAIQAIFDRAATALGAAIANHVNVWDPARIVVLFTNRTLIEMIEAPLRAAIDRNILFVLRDRVRIECRSGDEHSYSRGVAALVLEQLYLVPGERTRPAPSRRPGTDRSQTAL
jgi:transcriptional regulator of PTS gene